MIDDVDPDDNRSHTVTLVCNSTTILHCENGSFEVFPFSHYPVITKHDEPQPSVMVHLNRIPRTSISGM